MAEGNNNPVVQTILGHEVRFSVAEGKFDVKVNGIRFSAKTIDEVERHIYEQFRPKSKVKVLFGYLGRYVHSMNDITLPTLVEIVGFYIDRGRGRGATKTIGYVDASGNKHSLNRSFLRYNDAVVDELEKLKVEFAVAQKQYVERCKALYEQLEHISAEEILAELNSVPKVSNEESEVVRTDVPDIFRKEFEG